MTHSGGSLSPGRVRELRLAVLPPAAVPYREPLFCALSAREDICLRVLYQARRPAGWDMGEAWFPSGHAYDARSLRARQWPRPGRTPVMLPSGIGRALDMFGADVVVAWEFGPSAWLARAWCSRRDRPLVHFSELGAPAAEAVPAAQRKIHRLLAHRAAGAIGASTQARNRLVALGAAPARTLVSLQSVDAAGIRAAVADRQAATDGQPVADRPLPLSADRPLQLLCVARLVPDKNLAALIGAVASVGSDRVALNLIGDGPLRDQLQAQAAAEGALVRFHGSLDPGQTARAYAAADALALVSSHEPFGVALREGVAAGLPLIASSRAGATGDVAIAGRNAIVVDPADTRAITAAVRRLAEDPELRARLGLGSCEIDIEWPLQRSVDAFAEVVRLAAPGAG